MKKVISFFKKYKETLLFARAHNGELMILLFFIVVAAILRFNNIFNLNFFTYDQARDALFVKRMIVDHEWRLLGTQTSLPGMYLPPFYYYTLIPILWLSRLNPVGIDIYSAFIGVLTIPLIWFIGNKIFGRPAGIFSAGLFAVSPLVVELTRRAWNPNTLPFFILLTFWFVYLFYQKRRTKDFLLAFVFYGYSLSLHFGAWLLIPLFIFTWFFYLIKNKKISGLLGSLAIVLFFVSPLLFFELRHHFFLTSQAKIFFFDGGHLGIKGTGFFESVSSSLIALFTILISGKIVIGYNAPLEFSGKLSELFHFAQPISVVAQKPFSLSWQWWGLVIFLAILFLSFWLFFKRKTDKNYKKLILPLSLVWVWIGWGILASRFYSGKFFFFYYLFVFPAPFLLFGLLFQQLWLASLRRSWQKRIWRPLVLLAFFLIITFHLRYTTVFIREWRDINDLKNVAQVISKNISSNESFNIATIQKEADRWDRNAVDYRFFTESFGHRRALDWYPEDYQKAQILFVVSESGKNDVLNSTIMEIANFGPKKILGSWELPKNIVIYKLGK